MMTRQSPAVQKALDYVTPLCEDRSGGFERFTIAKLARAADVSLVTMWKTVNDLKKRGLATSISRRGTTLGRAAPRSLPVREMGGGPEGSPRTVWQHVLTQIKRDILRGVFRPGQALPSNKELRYRYRVSAPTLKKCLDHLISQGIVVPSQNTLALPLLAAAHHASRLVLLLDAASPGQTELATDRQRELLRSIEMACRTTGAALDMIRYDWVTGSLNLYSHPGNEPHALRDTADVLGYLVWSYRSAGVPEMLLGRILPFGKPVSFLDEVDLRSYPKRIVSRPHLRIFRMATSMQSSIEVARYLLSLGHLRIAYVSPFHGADWSRQRLAGLVETYREAGYPDAVLAVTVDDAASHLEYYAPAAERFQVDRLVESFAKWARVHAAELRNRFESYIIKYIKEECAFAEVSIRLGPLLERAARDRSITAWVAAEDRTAEFAGEFLRRRGLRIGAERSLIGFDDSYRAAERHLTSYNFNVSAVAEAMVRHVLNPVSFERLTREKYTEIPGVIIERQSAARARRAA